MPPALDATARESVASACDDVHDAGQADLVDGVAPALVARPASTDRGGRGAPRGRRARAHRRPPRPRHQADLGAAARPRSTWSSTSAGWTGVLDHAAGDLIVDTQAGTRSATCRRSSAEQGQRLALDEPVPGATHRRRPGHQQQRPAAGTVTGTARDLLIGDHRGARRRRRRQGRRPGGQERRRLRPRQADDRLVRHPRRDHRGGLPAAPAAPTCGAGSPSRSPTPPTRTTWCRPSCTRRRVPTAVELDWSADGSGTVAVLLEGRAAGGRRTRADGRRPARRDRRRPSEVRAGRLVGVPAGPRGGTGLKLTFVLSGLGRGARGRPRVGAGQLARLGRDRRAVRRAAGRPRRRRGGRPRVERLRAACARAQGGAVVVDGPADVKQQRRRLGAGARARPDAPGQGPVRPRRTGCRRADSWEASDVTEQTQQTAGPGQPGVGETGSIIDLGMPVAGGAFDEHHPPDAALIGDCVHCGFCLPTCPTYVLWGEEMDSPRGRIDLMKPGARGRADDRLDGRRTVDACLGCMACVTACPSGVQYDQLIEADPGPGRAAPRAQPVRPAAARGDLRAVPAPATAAAAPRPAPRPTAHRARPRDAAHRPARADGAAARGDGEPGPAARPRPSRCRSATPATGAASRGGRPAHRLRPGRVLPGRERRDRPGARRPRAATSSCPPSRAAAARCRAHNGREEEAQALRATARRHLRGAPASTRWSSTPPAAARR